MFLKGIHIAIILLVSVQLYSQKVGIGSTQFIPVSTLDIKGNLTIGSNYASVNGASADGLLVEGNTGIGTTSALQKLHLGSGNFRIEATTAGGNDGVMFVGATRFFHDYNGIFIGLSSGNFTNTGTRNLAIGNDAGQSLTDGRYNVFIGTLAGKSNTSGSRNTFIGLSGWQNIDGNENTFCGYGSGYSNISGSFNVFIGHNAGYSPFDFTLRSTTGSNNLYVGYGATGSSAINNASAIGNGAVVTAANTMVIGSGGVIGWGLGMDVRAGELLSVNGTTACLTNAGVWYTPSDKNLKKNFKSVNGIEILNSLMKLSITEWNYKSDSIAEKHIGPMAQDFYALFGFGKDDKTISVIDPSGIALAAIKELYTQLKLSNERILLLEKEIFQLKKNN